MGRSKLSKHYALHLDTAREYYDDGNYEAACAAARHAIESALPGEGAEARTLLALSLRKLEYNDEALQMLAEQIAGGEDTPEAMAEYSLMLAERGQCDDLCRTTAERAIESDPDIGSAYIALFWYHVERGEYVEALANLKKGVYRGAEFSESRAFDLIRGWCQTYSDAGDYDSARALSGAAADLFASFDFLVLHARLCELAGDDRKAVEYYRRCLSSLRPGSLRTEILEAIARIAI